MFWKRKKPVDIQLHRPGADVYVDGRYLVVNARLSLKSKRDRQIIAELAAKVSQYGQSQQPVIIGHEQSTGAPVLQDVVPRETGHSFQQPDNSQK